MFGYVCLFFVVVDVVVVDVFVFVYFLAVLVLRVAGFLSAAGCLALILDDCVMRVAVVFKRPVHTGALLTPTRLVCWFACCLSR